MTIKDRFLANFDKIAETVYYLKDRWRDEKEYEDFNDYVLAVKRCFATYMIEVDSVDKHFTVKCKGATIRFPMNGAVTLETYN